MKLSMLALASALVLTPAAQTHAEQELKPLRTIVYDVSYATVTTRIEKTSGFMPNGTGAIAAGNADVERRYSSDDRGTLTIEVIAATADGGLVVDARYAGKTRTQPRLRCAIFPDGRISYDPNAELSIQAERVLPFLARGFLSGRDVSPGGTWDVRAPAPASGTTTYRVLHAEQDQATLAYDGIIVVKGTAGFTEHNRGTTIYATELLSPISLELKSRVRREVGIEEIDTTDAHLVAILVSDSFRKR